MADLIFVDSHNMVAYLKKSEDNADFAEIVDFLNASSIKYALTTIVITESSVRRDLRFNDEDGISCLTNIEIFENLQLMGGPTTLVADETIHKDRGDNVERTATIATSLDAEKGSGGSPRRQGTMGDRTAQTRFERLSKQSNEPPLSRVNTLRSGEDNMKLQDLMDLCTKFSDKILDLENGRYGHDIGVNTTSTSITTANINITTTEPVTTAEKRVSKETATRLARGVIMKEASETATRPTVPPPQIDPKDKGKAKMRLQAELDEEAMLEREREEEASKAANIADRDDIQAMMDTDYELATKLQASEQGKISIEERSKLFMELMNERKKHFAKLRAEEQRRKPLTKA
ncbi:hypothetical protein Tco_0499194 [Tanacetum coccineum]